jgi:hypothetical protein
MNRRGIVIALLACGMWLASYLAMVWYAHSRDKDGLGYDPNVGLWCLVGLMLCNSACVAWVVWFGRNRAHARRCRILVATLFSTAFFMFGPFTAIAAWAVFYRWPAARRIDAWCDQRPLKWTEVVFVLWFASLCPSLPAGLAHDSTGRSPKPSKLQEVVRFLGGINCAAAYFVVPWWALRRYQKGNQAAKFESTASLNTGVSDD